MRSMHLFAGAGGGLLADLILGHEPVCAVEWDAYACAVLRERSADGWFPGLHVHEGDVRLFDPSAYAGRVDCIHAGFPCQDISVAGNGAGINGERSGLYREVLRIADVVRPRFIFLENSPAIVGNGLGTVLGDLAARGYDGRWTVLAAADVGAPHIRERWWGLFWRSDADRVRQLQPQGRERDQRGRTGDLGRQDASDASGQRRGEGWTESITGREAGAGEHRGEVANAQGEHEPSQQGLAYQERTLVGTGPGADGRAVGRHPATGSRDAGRNIVTGSAPDMGNATGLGLEVPQPGKAGDEQSASTGTDRSVGWWGAEPAVGRVAHGVAARTHQIAALGNGQVPLCAAAAWKILGGE